MSLSISANDLKFVIFASGHDYTLADSGDGDVQIFSHPFVPLNSVNYAGQYYFLVPDEDGNPIDAVKDDIAHCTFTPALGTAFDTEGEATVEVHYHREYIYGEETLVVDKTVSQKITVVNHGSVSSSATYCDLYSDGYAFYRPSSVNTAGYLQIRGNGQPTKVSSLPWRVTVLGDNGYDFLNAFNLTDISELQYADTSNVVHIQGLFHSAQNITSAMAKEAVGEWDLSSLQSLEEMAVYSTSFTDLSFMEKWTCPNLTSLWKAFVSMKNTTSLHGLEHLDVSNVTNLSQTFDDMSSLTDISAISGWDVSNATSMSLCFNNTRFANVDALATWTPTSLTDMSSMFRNCQNLQNVDGLLTWSPSILSITECFNHCYSLVDISGLANIDISGVSSLRSVFEDTIKLFSLEGLETWDTGNVSDFRSMFKNAHWVGDISAMGNWDFSSASDMSAMFSGNACVLNFTDLILDLSNASSLTDMFSSLPFLHIAELDVDAYETAYWYVDYAGNQHSKLGLTETYYTHDADDAENWLVSVSGANAFSNVWNNLPSWN